MTKVANTNLDLPHTWARVLGITCPLVTVFLVGCPGHIVTTGRMRLGYRCRSSGIARLPPPSLLP
jgi:hypothetical protein